MTARADLRGHRALEHTADTIIEGWGPDRDASLEEAVLALVEGFVDTAEAAVETRAQAELAAGTPEDMLSAVLEEVIYLLDVQGAVPVTVEISEGRARFGLAGLDAVEAVGPEPKAVALSGLSCAPAADGTWRARAIIDV